MDSEGLVEIMSGEGEKILTEEEEAWSQEPILPVCFSHYITQLKLSP